MIIRKIVGSGVVGWGLLRSKILEGPDRIRMGSTQNKKRQSIWKSQTYIDII